MVNTKYNHYIPVLTSSQELLWLEVLTGVVVVRELLLLLSNDLSGIFFIS